MYVILLGGILLTGLALLVLGLSEKRPGRVLAGASLTGFGIGLIVLMAFWAELLWFDALGFNARFWTFFWAKVLIPLAGATGAAALALLLTRGAGRHLRTTVLLLCC